MRRDLGALLHAAIGALAVALAPVGVLALLVYFGIYRELWQHPDSMLRDWRLHRWVEALAWSLGGLIGYALARWVL